MAISVQMPALGESVTEGTVTRWLKQEGDTVEVDEPLLEVSTDKVDTEIPSPAAGVLQKIVAQEDDTVEVGGELGVIGEAGESGGDDSGSTTQAPTRSPKPRSRNRPRACRARGARRRGAGGRTRAREGTRIEAGRQVVGFGDIGEDAGAG